jgi:lysozyme
MRGEPFCVPEREGMPVVYADQSCRGWRVNEIELAKELEADEGKVPHAYLDSLGFLTIGVGRMVDERMHGHLSDDEIQYILRNDITSIETSLDHSLPWWRGMDEDRQRVLANMCFNLGIDKLLLFKQTLDAMREGRYEAAANGMLASLWARQVGARAQRLADRMRGPKTFDRRKTD